MEQIGQGKGEAKLQLSNQGYVTLPFNNEEFKDFVVGLLGKPQTITGNLEGSFELQIEDIRNLYELINQRITQQNDGVLIQFNALITFSDETSVLINSIQELLTYKVIRPIISESVHLTFQYLIKFQDKNVPEKQEINVSFTTLKKTYQKVYDKELVPYLLTNKLVNRLINKHGGFIDFNIKHTARTWGADIESLLMNHFNTMLIPEIPFKKFLRKQSDGLSGFLFLTLLSLGIWFTYNYNQKHITEREHELSALFKQSPITIQDLSSQIKFVAINGSYDSSGIYILGGFISILIALFATFISSEMISIPKYSYVLLTPESYNNKKIKDKKYNQQFTNYIISIIVSIATSVIANYIYIYMNPQ